MSYKILQDYYENNLDHMQVIIDKLEKKIATARDKKELPIYMTRARVKNIQSTYLKTKRKGDNPNKKKITAKYLISDITDMIGLRILCLFEQDINDTFEFILSMCLSKHYKLKEIIVYGWDKTSVFQNAVNKYEYNINIKFKEKESGYKSIHFVGTYSDFDAKEKYTFEIQLRTLLQDVWGELEHKLAYKQRSRHPFVKNGFQRLSQHLQTNDMLLSQLKDIIDESKCNKNKVDFNLGAIFRYENEKLPNEFKKSGNLHKEYKKYKKKIYKDSFNDINFDNVKKQFEKIVMRYNTMNPKESIYNNKFIYWKDMENAYFHTRISEDGSLDKAKRIYEKFKSEKSSYVSLFRLGQIYFHEGKLVKALEHFDSSLKMIKKNSHENNLLKIHINMALIFWNNGNEYLISAINSIEKALIIYQNNKKKLGEGTKEALYNSACWYYMECYMNSVCKKKKKKNIKYKSKKYYKKLLKIVDQYHKRNRKAKKHTYDTLAWYNYQKFIDSDHDTRYLKKAKKYADLLYEGDSPINQYYSHEAIQKEHIYRIGCEYHKYIKE